MTSVLLTNKWRDQEKLLNQQRGNKLKGWHHTTGTTLHPSANLQLLQATKVLSTNTRRRTWYKPYIEKFIVTWVIEYTLTNLRSKPTLRKPTSILTRITVRIYTTREAKSLTKDFNTHKRSKARTKSRKDGINRKRANSTQIQSKIICNLYYALSKKPNQESRMKDTSKPITCTPNLLLMSYSLPKYQQNCHTIKLSIITS